jgi:hypothetical protein
MAPLLFCGMRAQAASTLLSGYCSGWGGQHFGVFMNLGSPGSCFGLPVSSELPVSQYAVGVPMPSSGVLANLTVVAYSWATATPQAPVPIQIQVWVNSVVTDLACAFTMDFQNRVQKFTCTDNTNKIPVNPGDLVAVTMSTPLPNGSVTRSPYTMVVSLEKQ